MGDVLTWAVVLPVALAAGTIGGTVGFGSAVLLVPVCAFAFGPQATVPLLTVAALLGNLSRTAFSWRETDWRAAGVYVLGAVPAAALGARIFVQLDAALIQRILGLFIIAMVPAGRYAARMRWRVALWQLLPVGLAMGFLSGLVGTTGPVNAPFFLAYGLVKGAYLATEALGAAAVHATKSVLYGRFEALDGHLLLAGTGVGLALVGGSYLGRRIVDRLDPARFRAAVEVMLVVAGLLMLAGW